MNKDFKIVLSGHTKSSRCKCINCYYGIVDVFHGNLLNNKTEPINEEASYREVLSEKIEK